MLAARLERTGRIAIGEHGIEEAYIDLFVATLADERGAGDVAFELDAAGVALVARLGIPLRVTTCVVPD